MDKKAQVTLFIVIGVVILFIFIFLGFINNAISRNQLEKEADRIVADLLKSGALNYYVDVCLDKAAKDAIVLAGACPKSLLHLAHARGSPFCVLEVGIASSATQNGSEQKRSRPDLQHPSDHVQVYTHLHFSPPQSMPHNLRVNIRSARSRRMGLKQQYAETRPDRLLSDFIYHVGSLRRRHAAEAAWRYNMGFRSAHGQVKRSALGKNISRIMGPVRRTH